MTHPLDQTRQEVRIMLNQLHRECEVSRACDIIMNDYFIPAPDRCGDCTEELKDGIRSSKTCKSLDRDQGSCP